MSVSFARYDDWRRFGSASRSGRGIEVTRVSRFRWRSRYAVFLFEVASGESDENVACV